MQASHFRKRTLPLVLVMTGIAGIIYATRMNAPMTNNLIAPNIKPVDAAADSLDKQSIQVVFALDATGSMGGLIAAAKEKIWSIASSLSQTKEGIPIEMGLVFYRDLGDDFVTRQIPLSGSLDDVYRELMSIDANGGGDSPESVNQGLWEAVDQMKWASGNKAFKAIFLVGDQPPHMDYKQDVKYNISCKKAHERGIVINTILMGGDGQARTIWKEIADCAQGSFFQMDMDVNNVEISTPYDPQISKLSDEIEQGRMYYGDMETIKKQSAKVEKSVYISSNASDEVKSRRAEYNMSASGNSAFYGEKELIQDYSKGKVDLAKLKDIELPHQLLKMTLAERKAFLDQAVTKRKAQEQELKQLAVQRQAYLEKEMAKMDDDKVKSSFNNQVFESVQKQAAEKEIRIEGKAKY